MTAGYESLMFLLISDNQDRLLDGKNLPEILQGYPQHYGGNNEYSYHNLLWRMDKICLSDKPYCTVASGVGDLYRNPVLCERLAGRTGIFLKSNLFIGAIYIYFHANIYYHISMKGCSK